jgi:hypothetical protein
MFFNLIVPTILLCALLLPVEALARDDVGLGFVAKNLMGSVSFVSDFVVTACLVIGSAFLFASIIKYVEHRRNPLMVPISTVIFLFVAGLLLVLLPLASMLTDGGP